MTNRALQIGSHSYPVVLPSTRDPRLHVAAVIITIHVLGQVALQFQVSVPQILAAMVTCAVIEIVWTLRQTGSLVWPASAMLTGSGVALILRAVGTRAGDPWSWHAWYLFAIVAGLSLATKYVIRYRGSHVFNPSNIGLVLAFIILGSSRVEPLDFWWAPLGGPMVIAYLVILVGGALITARLHLLAMAVAFWLTFGAGLGILAASGHCMTARWSFAPVCGFDFWSVIVTSPEILIFLFFMITDPKTIPGGHVGRILFGICVAVASTLLIAPQTTEFGAKVGLLAGLVLICATRPLLDRFLPAANSDGDQVRRFVAGLVSGGTVRAGLRGVLLRSAIAVSAVMLLGIGIVAAGTPARSASADAGATVLQEIAPGIDRSTLPTVTYDQNVRSWNSELAGPGAQDLAVALAENLEVENQALLRRDPGLLTAVDHGDRLAEMWQRVDAAISTGRAVVSRYAFDSLHLSVVLPGGVQTGLSAGLHARGTLTQVTYDAAGNEIDRTSAPFSLTFVMRPATGGRWLNVATLPEP